MPGSQQIQERWGTGAGRVAPLATLGSGHDRNKPHDVHGARQNPVANKHTDTTAYSNRDPGLSWGKAWARQDALKMSRTCMWATTQAAASRDAASSDSGEHATVLPSDRGERPHPYEEATAGEGWLSRLHLNNSEKTSVPVCK